MSEFAVAEQPLGVSALGGSAPATPLVLDPTVTIISQYANSPRITQLVDYMRQWIDPTARLDDFYNLVWNVDTAVGWGLDVLGRIVGVTRVLQVPATNYFGFEGNTGAVPFGQGPFYLAGAATANYALTDDAFRKLILAKAQLNLTNASIPAINAILLNLFSTYGDVHVTDGLDMTMTYTFPVAISAVDFAIVTQSGVLPKPIGVSYTVVQ